MSVKAMLRRFGVVAAATVAATAGMAVTTTSAASADATCAWYEPCGVVHNRTGRTLEVSRDSSTHWGCTPKGPYNWLPSGSNSDTRFGWEDADCFRSHECSVFYAGVWYNRGEWVRIYSHVWVYDTSC
ncbi:hypothetical protein [Actinokineospora sp. HUAS TT18]|uniref:hypothetical protein n=1 Tax=Actinokineospora sp. HUAS TT18 TaxID=3447451 RepID=UPI003F524233